MNMALEMVSIGFRLCIFCSALNHRYDSSGLVWAVLLVAERVCATRPK